MNDRQYRRRMLNRLCWYHDRPLLRDQYTDALVCPLGCRFNNTVWHARLARLLTERAA